jgi:hypothetical protein
MIDLIVYIVCVLALVPSYSTILPQIVEHQE